MIKTITGLSLGSILLALGLPAQAQQPTKIARVGYLSPETRSAGVIASRRSDKPSKSLDT